jgi:hypothetical protein
LRISTGTVVLSEEGTLDDAFVNDVRFISILNLGKNDIEDI